MLNALSLLIAAVFSLGELENSSEKTIPDATIEGDVVEVFRDDIDAGFEYVVVMEGYSVLPIVCKLRDDESLDGLIDSHIRVTGYYSPAPAGLRIFSDPHLLINRPSDIVVIRPASDIFAVPELHAIRAGTNPKSLTRLGRRRVSGLIKAVWDSNQALLTTTNGAPIRLILRRNTPIPAVGTSVTAVGRVTSDLFHYVLDLATYRTEQMPEPSSSIPNDIPLCQLYVNAAHSSRVSTYDAGYDGQLVRIRGRVRSMPVREAGLPRLILEEDGFEAAVDVSVLPDAALDLCVGCVVEVTGVYVIDSPIRNPTRISPRVNGFVIAPRTADDIALLQRPPWWTPHKLAVVIGILLVLLLLALAWSSSLRILVDRRSRQLAHRQAEAIHARLKTAERTRLAAELHDSVVQNLTGAALEARAARTALPKEATASDQHLDIVLKTINSSRAELRNCIWDLRNQALEAMDVDEAIRITLKPHLNGTALRVRFNIPRERIPDSDFHNILCIIRELVINAVRHGKASLIKIAGALQGERIRFSVTDNGCGFDIKSKPGMEQGHFGIEGIAERAKALGGTLLLTSSPGNGTRADLDIASASTDQPS